MAYIAPIHRPSSVRHAVKLSFLSEGSEDLVVARSNQLEIWSPNPQAPDLLSLRFTRSIYGKVTLMHKLRPITSNIDHLFVGTDKFHYFTLSWDADKKELQTQISYVDVADKAARDSQTGDRIAIDPTNRFIALECYEGVINILPITQPGKGKSRAADNKIGEIGDPIPVRVPELFVRSTCFLYKKEQSGPRLPNPEIAILEEDMQQNLRVKVRILEYSPSLRPQEEPASVDLATYTEVDGGIEIGSSHLIPLPPPMYGFLIVGETCISYVADQNYKLAKTKPLSEATVFVCWCAIDDQRYVLADDYGKLYLLYVVQDDTGNYKDHQLDFLGTTSRATALVYLDSGRVFVGSSQGDSQLIRIVPQALEVLQVLPNIAPVLDFTVMDMGNRSTESVVNEFSSGQARIVTGSGAYQDGSLRSVRSGVGLEDLGTIAPMGRPVTAMFGVRSTSSINAIDTLVVSFHDATRAFRFNSSGEVGELLMAADAQPAWQHQETLHAGQMLQQHTVHVSSTSVSIGEIFTSTGAKPRVTHSWSPSRSEAHIYQASAQDDYILLSIQGKELVVLSFGPDGLSVKASTSFDADQQVSCIATSTSLPNACLAGFWKGSAVALLSLDTLDIIASVAVADDSLVIARSLRVACVLSKSQPILFAGLTDGTVVTYSMQSGATPFTSKKSMIIGTQQPTFALLPRGNGQQNIFASCEHPSLIYGSEGRMVYSAVTAQDSTAVCAFDCEAYPGSIAIATGSEGTLRLAVVDEERTTHVETLSVRETVRRIAYSATLKSFALGCIKRTLTAGVEEVQSHLKLVDEVVFKELHTYSLDPDELIECLMRCQLEDKSGSLVERFVVGTAFLDDASKDSARGRILIFEVTEDRKLRMVLQKELKGACRCLAMCDGRIVAALIKTVTVFALVYSSSNQPTLERRAAYRTATAPIDLVVTDNTVAVTDLMKSLSLLEFTRGTAGDPDSLSEIARHFETLWSTAISKVADDTYLQADAEGNLVVLHHERSSYSEEDKRRLRVTSELQLGELVNRIRRIDVQPSADAVIIPRAFVATVEGGIYLFALIAPGKQDFLMRMQSQMAAMVKSPGYVPFAKYRGFKSGVRDMGEDGPMRFVDGTLIERFLDCEESIQLAIIEGLGVDLEETRTMIETLRRTH